MKKPVLDPRNPDFNWLDALNYLCTKRGIERTSRYEFDELLNGAAGWPTCACGQLCKALPKRAGGAPADMELYHYGCNFVTAVNFADLSHGHNDRDRITNVQRYMRDARQVFHSIEKRSSELLAQLEPKQ